MLIIKNSRARDLQQALQLHQAGDLIAAGEIYTDILREEPGNPDALHLLGVIALQQGRDMDAEKLVRQALAINYNDHFYHNNLGEILQKQGRLTEALECYTHALALVPDYPEAISGYAEVQRKLQGSQSETVGAPRSRIQAKDRMDEWIASVVPGKTFADIGGIGVNSCNERITFGMQCGAKSATMVDIRPQDYYEWAVFRKKCAELGVSGYGEIPSTDINDPNLYEKMGSYDVVHCTGIFYHLPSPLLAFENLAKTVDKYLIINTITIPDTITNKFGTLNYSGSLAYSFPVSMSRNARYCVNTI